MKISSVCAATLGLGILAGAVGAQTPAGFELRTGIEVFNSQDSTIQGLHALTVLWDLGNHFYAGQSFYSAAIGDAGGAFFWGFELGKRIPLSERVSLSFQGFLGGGGGAGEVPGDGLMTRVYAGTSFAVSDRFALDLGASHVRILGSPVDTLSYGLGMSYRPGGWDATGPLAGHNVVERLSAIRPSARVFRVGEGRTARNGSVQEDVTLAGAEIAFALNPTSEIFINADGAVAGDGEGYMNVLGGYRLFANLDVVRPYIDASIGFGGGGDIDTGAGLLLSVGVGAAVEITPRFEILAGVQHVQAADGNFAAWSPYIRGSFNLRVPETGDWSRQRQPWRLAYSTGITHQFANAEFRKPGDLRTANPTLNVTAIDIFLTDKLYFTGEAQTVMYGEAGGYALGLLGAGYKIDLSARWFLSIEGLIGAAGGGGVATNGGLIAGGRAELDYALTDAFHLTVGLGYLQAINGGGMAPITVHVGVKIPFELGG